MTSHPTRPAAAMLAGLVLALAAGCGKPPAATTAADKPGDPKGTPTPPVTTPPTPTPTPTGPTLADPTGPAQKEAEKFVKDLRDGTAAPDRLTPAFLKVIGKPLLSPADKERGSSTAAAEAWLKRAGAALTGVGVPTGYATPTVAVFVGSFTNPAVPDGRVLLRLVQADGGWKVDGFGLGAAKASEPPKPTGPDEPFQDFAATAFLDALTAGPAVPKDDRVPLLGAVLSAKAKTAWAEPFGGDKDRGYDFNPTKLGQIADTLTDPAGAYTRTRTGPDSYKVELTKGGKPVAYTLKLVKGAAPGEWLVDEFAAQ